MSGVHKGHIVKHEDTDINKYLEELENNSYYYPDKSFLKDDSDYYEGIIMDEY